MSMERKLGESKETRTLPFTCNVSWDFRVFRISEKSKVLRHFQHFPASAGASTRPFRVADFVDFPWDPHDFRKDFKGFARPELARMRILMESQRDLKDF